jgi:hypothetical protein
MSDECVCTAASSFAGLTPRVRDVPARGFAYVFEQWGAGVACLVRSSRMPATTGLDWTSGGLPHVLVSVSQRFLVLYER